MLDKKRVVNHKLVAFMSEFGITNKDLASIIGKSTDSVTKKINNKKFTQEEMQKILVSLKTIDIQIDMNIFA